MFSSLPFACFIQGHGQQISLVYASTLIVTQATLSSLLLLFPSSTILFPGILNSLQLNDHIMLVYIPSLPYATPYLRLPKYPETCPLSLSPKTADHSLNFHKSFNVLLSSCTEICVYLYIYIYFFFANGFSIFLYVDSKYHHLLSFWPFDGTLAPSETTMNT